MRCKNKIVLITGASSGIGQACAEAFAKEGAKLLLCARNTQKLKELADQLIQQFHVEVFTFSLDVRDYSAVESSFKKLPESWRNIDVLVNNAGLSLGLEKIQDANIADWEQMLDTNVKGLLYVTKMVLPGMIERNQGHVINLGSISSFHVYAGGVVYCASKFAERAISEGLKMDVHGTNIRVTSIDPGMVKTNFSIVRFAGDQAKADAVYEGMTPLLPEDIADAIIYCATRPPHVNIRQLLIMPTDQTAPHLCHRKK